LLSHCGKNRHGVWEQGAEEKKWTKDGGYGGRLEKTA
jgi:hypothetical protein